MTLLIVLLTALYLAAGTLLAFFLGIFLHRNRLRAAESLAARPGKEGIEAPPPAFPGGPGDDLDATLLIASRPAIPLPRWRLVREPESPPRCLTGSRFRRSLR